MSKLSDIERLLNNFETNHKEQRGENSTPAVAVLSFQDARALLAIAKAVEAHFEVTAIPENMLRTSEIRMIKALEALYHD